MSKTTDTIVFFGSGPVAAASLQLLAEDFVIEAVVTKPRPPHHKGDVPVIALAKELHVPILTTENKQSLSDLFATKPVHSRVAVLIDFGIIVGQDVIDYFPLGIVNSHFSLLPEWRGADPISFAILSGQPKTGVSLMLLVAGMDEGPILAYGEYDIPAHYTTPQLTDALVELSAALLSHTLPKYIAGELQPAPQSADNLSYSRKLDKQDGILDWHKTAAELEREVRAFYGWPRSRTTLGGHELVITKAHVVDDSGTPGSLWRDDKAFGVYCIQGALVFDEVIPAGKKPMPAAAFLAGNTLS